MKKLEKKNRIIILFLVCIVICSLLFYRFLVSRNLEKSGLAVLPVLAILSIVIALYVQFKALFQLQKWKRTMEEYEKKNKHWGKLYFSTINRNNKTSAHGMIITAGGTKAVCGADEYGEFVYFTNVPAGGEGAVLEPTSFSLTPFFFMDEYGVPMPSVELEFVFDFANTRNLLVYSQQQNSFGMVHNWSGKIIEEAEEKITTVVSMEEYWNDKYQ